MVKTLQAGRGRWPAARVEKGSSNLRRGLRDGRGRKVRIWEEAAAYCGKEEWEG